MSEPRRLVVIGGGGHARAVIDAARAAHPPFEVLGFLDPREAEETSRLTGLPNLGGDERVALLAAGAGFVLGVGAIRSESPRAEIAARCAAHGARWVTVVHERALVSRTAQLGEGTVIMAGAVVGAGCRVGRHAIVNSGAILEHDVVAGDFASVGPGAVVGGGSRLGEASFLGLGCRVRDNTNVGRGATVGMGAVVLGPVSEGATVVGVPARARRAGQ